MTDRTLGRATAVRLSLFYAALFLVIGVNLPFAPSYLATKGMGEAEIGALLAAIQLSRLVGNPHAVFFVADAESIDIAALGPVLERHPLFPERANIEVASLLGANKLRMRVWERGVGITRACGTGACASLVAAARRKLTGREGEIVLDGGSLEVEWLPDDHVRMTGPVAISFAGELPG